MNESKLEVNVLISRRVDDEYFFFSLFLPQFSSHFLLLTFYSSLYSFFTWTESLLDSRSGIFLSQSSNLEAADWSPKVKVRVKKLKECQSRDEIKEREREVTNNSFQLFSSSSIPRSFFLSPSLYSILSVPFFNLLRESTCRKEKEFHLRRNTPFLLSVLKGITSNKAVLKYC